MSEVRLGTGVSDSANPHRTPRAAAEGDTSSRMSNASGGSGGRHHPTGKHMDRSGRDSPASAAEAHERPVPNTIQVRAATLYTEMLDACDWREHVIRTQRAAQAERERRAQRERDRQEREQRRMLQEKRLHDARVMAESRKRRLAQARELAEATGFQQRSDAFQRRQAGMRGVLAPLDAQQRAHAARVRQRLHGKWEQEVFLPVQTAINAQVEAGPLAAPTGKGTEQRREQLRAERREAYLRESSKKERGLFLDTIDATEYDPIGQRAQATVRYTAPVNLAATHASASGRHGRTGHAASMGASTRAAGKHPNLSTMASGTGNGMGNASKRENDLYVSLEQRLAQEREVKQAYARLALAYREEELRSRTGVLSARAAVPTNPATAITPTLSLTSTTDAVAGEDRGLSAATPHETAARPSVFAATVRSSTGRAASLRRTHIPYNLGGGGGGSSSAGPGWSARVSLQPFAPALPPTTTTAASVAGLADGASSHAVGMTSPEHVMPLPPVGAGQGGRPQQDRAQLLKWYCPTEGAGASGGGLYDPAAPSFRQRALPIPTWEAHKLQDTFFARYVEPDGDGKRDFCERKRWEGEMILASTVQLT